MSPHQVHPEVARHHLDVLVVLEVVLVEDRILAPLLQSLEVPQSPPVTGIACFPPILRGLTLNLTRNTGD